jgi:hypothetical protein
LPVEISVNAIRFVRQNDLTVGDYHDLMMDNIDTLTCKRVMALRECWDHASPPKVLQEEIASAKAAYTCCRSYHS